MAFFKPTSLLNDSSDGDEPKVKPNASSKSAKPKSVCSSMNYPIRSFASLPSLTKDQLSDKDKNEKSMVDSPRHGVFNIRKTNRQENEPCETNRASRNWIGADRS